MTTHPDTATSDPVPREAPNQPPALQHAVALAAFEMVLVVVCLPAPR